MLDIQFIRENPERVKEAITHKKTGSPEVVDKLLVLDQEWRETLTKLQEVQANLNARSKSIGELMRNGKKEEAETARQETTTLKSHIKEIEDWARSMESERHQILLEIPNIPHPDVPIGRDESGNQVVFEWGIKPMFDFPALSHWELAAKHNLIDFERGSKVTGAGFPFYIGKGARLQRALINFFLDLAVNEGGYTEIQPPLMINEASGIGTGQLPDKEGQMYEATLDRLFMVPTAEVPVTNFLRDEILDEAQLPLLYCAYTPCFRREAGSYGKDVRGLNRLHQFDKVELVRFVHPDSSYEHLEGIRQNAENALQKLGLPYHRLLMCTGDLGFTQTKKYDLEVWSGAQKRWLEVSSISNFESFQARRANIRFRSPEAKKPQFVHTLNGSGLALPRILGPLLENGQQADGSILLPEALAPYAGFDRIG
ncbi:MAG: serine--tRNA ligase [Rhodothermia bacterium]|nr:serine--tRNA ligase [Rhodothermia bacterium]